MPRKNPYALIAVIAAVLLWSCSSTKHVPQGRLLLDKVAIKVDNDSVKPSELYNYLRQTPNHKVLGFAKMQLGIYSLSGRDTTRWYNRWLQKLGQAPVVYDPGLTSISQQQLRQALVNKGYLHAVVDVDSAANYRKKRMALTYNVHPGEPMRIASVRYEIPDTAVARIFYADSAALPHIDGSLLDRTLLDQYRTDIAALLRRKGYYAFAKDYVTFVADTVAGSHSVALTMHINPPRAAERGVESEIAEVITPETTVIEDSFSYAPPSTAEHRVYRLRNVYFVTDYNAQRSGASLDFADQDTVVYKGIKVLYGPDRYIAPGILEEKCFLKPGDLYNSREVENTYEALNQLGILRYVNIVFVPEADNTLDAYILLSRNKKQGITFELEGTNSEGDLGFGAGITYQMRNLAKRSNLLTVKVRGAYEHLSGNYKDLINNRYTEFAGEVGITFPKFEFPFLNSVYKRRRKASTEFALSGNYQERPEYTRIIAGAAWRYKWSHRRGLRRTRYQFDLIDINYVRLPKSTLNFLDSIAPSNPLLRYSYEDHFIMRTGLNVYVSNRRIPSGTMEGATYFQPSIRTFHGSVEFAGNVLYALSKLTGQKKQDDAYKVFGIQYAQYFKAEADYTYTINFNDRNSLTFHAGGGVAVPYLNSSMVPFEKRFYAGGANGVRGWGVRTLGPGSYDSKNSVTNFINQCGDILLNLNMEYRAKLFWVFEGALFIDAGNVWTIRDYENQPGGVFKFDKFYKQLAASYGMGLRLDFTYFLLRLDLGVKAHNPSTNQASWPLFHPSWRRDVNFHFAVGYPF